jgi:hypothetical protein
MSSSAETAARHALALFLRAAGDPRPALDGALADDPDCVAAHLLGAGLAVAAKDRSSLGDLDRRLAALAPLESRLDERERLHLAAARAWHAGAHDTAAATYARVAARWPHDLLAIRLAHSCHFLLGAPCDSASRALPHWREGMPELDALLAMHAFAREEAGDCAGAEAAARRALAIEPRNPVAIHAVAHALGARDAAEEGRDWLDARSAVWADGGAMASHNWWHVALFELDCARADRALAIYDAELAPVAGRSGADAADAAALLWRAGLQGVDVGPRWPALAEAFALHPQPSLWWLVDIHAAMAFAAAGRARELDRLRGGLASGGRLARELVLPLVEAIEAFVAGELTVARAMFASRTGAARRLGGSWMQREILDRTLGAARQAAARAA